VSLLLCECIDGDEVVVAHPTTFAQAEAMLKQIVASTPRAEMSIWGPAGILALWNTNTRRLVITRAGTAAIHKEASEAIS
jgi:hypothetical protein